MPMYRFTGKELDPETGLYYFGARYYDPVLSRWISADPILGKYLPTGNRDRDEKLAGFGGVYNPANLGLYGYAHLNPLTYIDPNGAETSTPVFNFKYTQGVQLGVTLGQRGGVSLKLSVNIARTEESLLTGEKATSQSIDFPKIGFGKWWFGIHGERSNSRHPDPRQYYANGDPVPFTGETVFDVLSNRKFEWTFFGENELGGKGKFSGGDFILELGYEAPLLPSFEGSINVSAGLRKLNLTGSPNISSVPNVGAPTNKFGGAPSGGTGIDPYLSTRPTTPSSN